MSNADAVREPPPAVPDVPPLSAEIHAYSTPEGPMVSYDYAYEIHAVAERLRAGWGKAEYAKEQFREALDAETHMRKRAEQDLSACRELLSMHNMGGMTDYNDGPMKRAIAAEAECERLREKLQQLLPKLYSDMERT